MPELTFASLGPEDYSRAKKVLDRAKHPGFVGRELYFRCATTGSATIAILDGEDSGVALIAKGKLHAMSIIRAAQGHGVGTALLKHTKPQWVNAITDRIPWFEKRGYSPVGGAKPGLNGKLATQLMQLTGSIPDAEVAAVSADHPPGVELAPGVPSLDELVTELPRDRAHGELMILDRLLASAEKNGDFKAAISLLEESRKIWQRWGAREE